MINPPHGFQCQHQLPHPSVLQSLLRPKDQDWAPLQVAAAASKPHWDEGVMTGVALWAAVSRC